MSKVHKAKKKKERFKLEKGAQFWTQNVACQLFHQAVSDNDFEQVEWQLKNGVDIDICDDKKRTALHIASASSFAKIVHLLIQYGANVNAKDINENTPLHLAVIGHKIEIVTTLLKAGANVLLNDVYNRTPIDAAKSRLRLLKSFQRADPQIDEEIQKIVEMLGEYSFHVGNSELVKQVDILKDKFEKQNFEGDKVEELSQLLEGLST